MKRVLYLYTRCQEIQLQTTEQYSILLLSWYQQRYQASHFTHRGALSRDGMFFNYQYNSVLQKDHAAIRLCSYDSLYL
jgi:hypothetical protein